MVISKLLLKTFVCYQIEIFIKVSGIVIGGDSYIIVLIIYIVGPTLQCSI